MNAASCRTTVDGTPTRGPTRSVAGRLPTGDVVRPNGQAHPPLAIDLFAGAGGLSQGFRNAGFKLVQAIEKNAAAGATYAANHPDVDIVCADIQS